MTGINRRGLLKGSIFGMAAAGALLQIVGGDKLIIPFC